MSVHDWITEQAHGLATAALVGELGARLNESGVPVWRISTSYSPVHPEVAFYNVRWTRDGAAVVYLRPQGTASTTSYTKSPFAYVYEHDVPEVRRRLRGPEALLDFPICEEIAAQGATDYLLQAFRFGGGRRGYVAYATREPDGFGEGEIEALRRILPVLSARMEVLCLDYTMRSLLRTYLGGNAAERVLSGAVTRGSGVPIEAAIWYCDLRGFTSLADRRPAAEVVATLDRYFEIVAAPIAGHGGEILKFIGDAVLAIFPVGESRRDACSRALTAALAVPAAVRDCGLPIEMGLALHVGEVNYGNVGATDRLDFTVIGAAVNEVCRVESLCKDLGRTLLVTAAFAQACPDTAFEPLGAHLLKGVSAAQEIYTPRIESPLTAASGAVDGP